MKAIINSIEYLNEFESQFGTLYCFKIKYNNVQAFYNSKKREQNKFIPNKEAEFTEEKKEGKNGEYYVIKPIYAGSGGGYNKQVKREQNRYSGFSASYIKDMLISGILKPELTKEDIEYNNQVLITLRKRSKEIFDHMVKLDKTFEL